MKGGEQERILARLLYRHGFMPIRSPASGTAPREQPDVLAAQQGIAVALELKTGGPPRNPDEQEVEDLMAFADAFWASGLVAARFKGDRTFYLALPKTLDRTPSGNYSIPSDPDDFPWSVALPYDFVDPQDVDDPDEEPTGIVPKRDQGIDGVVYARALEAPPNLADWLDAVAAMQQGYQVRRGVVDQNRDDRDLAADGGDEER